MGAIGWYGKLPSAGDFLGRRLPPEFQGPWDHWLQRGLAHGRHAHGERWSDTYLTFPVWRFILPAGHLGPAAWCGVLMPSVDRVGRLFPLTICESLPMTRPLPGLRAIDAHLAQFAHAGLDAIDGMSVDDFDLRLGALRPMPPDRNPADGVRLEAFLGAAATGCWTLDEPLAQALAGAAERIMLESLSDRALWWLPPDDVEPGRMRLVRLPLTAAVLDELISNPTHTSR
jgi:type VI secretion system protein ImpM